MKKKFKKSKFGPAQGSRNRGNGPCVDLTTYYSVEEDYDGKSDDEGSKYWMVEDLEQTLKLRSDAQEDQMLVGKIQKDQNSSGSKSGKVLVNLKLQADSSQISNDQNLVGKIQKDQKIQADESTRKSKDLSLDLSDSKTGIALVKLQADGSQSSEDQKKNWLGRFRRIRMQNLT